MTPLDFLECGGLDAALDSRARVRRWRDFSILDFHLSLSEHRDSSPSGNQQM